MVCSACCDCDEPEPTPDPTASRVSTVSLYNRDGQGVFNLSTVTNYFYSDATRLERTESSLFNSSTQQLIPYAKTTFTYNGSGRLSLLEAVVTGTSVKESVEYQYDNTGRVTHMAVDNSNAIPDVDISITYETGDTLKAVYQYDTGDSFTYKAFVKEGNIAYEKTIKDGNRLSTEFANRFDDHINPFYSLGYIDPMFTNYSKNNKLSVASQYHIGTAEGQPEFYDYTYNEAGLPLTQLVTLKVNSPKLQQPTLKYVFEYE
jgi:hypothetical protein